MFDPLSVFVGAACVGLAWFGVLAAGKGLPAIWSWLKARWSAGGTQFAELEAAIDALEKGAVAELRKGLAALRSDVEALKAAPSANPPSAKPVPPPAPPSA